MNESKSTISFFAALGTVVLGMVVVFITTSFRDYQGFAYFDYPGLIQEVIARTIGAVLVLPTIHVLIASIWQSQRNPTSRRKIFIGWTIAIVISQLFALYSRAN